MLYVFVLNPTAGEIELPSLGLKTAHQSKKIKSIKMIGSNEEINFKQDNNKLILNVPAKRPNIYAAVFEVKGAL